MKMESDGRGQQQFYKRLGSVGTQHPKCAEKHYNFF